MAREKPKIQAGAGVELGEMLGHGLEKTVYEQKDRPDKVIGVYHEVLGKKPEVTKARYYLMNILHMLYPKWFVHFSQVGQEKLYKSGRKKGKEKNANYYITDKLELSEEHNRMSEIQYKHGEHGELKAEADEMYERLRTDPQFLEFKEEMERIEMAHAPNISGGLEMATVNFSKNSEGNLNYIDTADPFFDNGRLVADEVELAFSAEKLRSRIMEKLADHEQIQALAHLDRILILQKELTAERKKDAEKLRQEFEKGAEKREREWQKKFGKKK